MAKPMAFKTANVPFFIFSVFIGGMIHPASSVKKRS
jgi:hypothetical protein